MVYVFFYLPCGDIGFCLTWTRYSKIAACGGKHTTIVLLGEL